MQKYFLMQNTTGKETDLSAMEIKPAVDATSRPHALARGTA